MRLHGEMPLTDTKSLDYKRILTKAEPFASKLICSLIQALSTPTAKDPDKPLLKKATRALAHIDDAADITFVQANPRKKAAYISPVGRYGAALQPARQIIVQQ